MLICVIKELIFLKIYHCLTRTEQKRAHNSWHVLYISHESYESWVNDDDHYSDVIMGAIASQIASLTIVYSTVNSDVDQRKHQSSASLAFVRGIHRGPVNSPHKWSVTRKIFLFDDVIMVFDVPLHCIQVWIPHKWCILPWWYSWSPLDDIKDITKARASRLTDGAESSLGACTINSECRYDSKFIYMIRLKSWAFLLGLLSDECHETYGDIVLMLSTIMALPEPTLTKIFVKSSQVK